MIGFPQLKVEWEKDLYLQREESDTFAKLLERRSDHLKRLLSRRKIVSAHRFAGYNAMPPHSDICQVAPYNRLGLNNVLAIEDDILRPAKNAGSRHPVPAGSLDVLRLVEWDVGQLHFIWLCKWLGSQHHMVFSPGGCHYGHMASCG